MGEKFDYEEFGAQLAFERDYPGHIQKEREQPVKQGLSLQEAMNMLKEIDSVPKDRTLVLYVKNEGYTTKDYSDLMYKVKQLNEEGAVQHVIVMPYGDLEIRELTDEDKNRLRALLNL